MVTPTVCEKDAKVEIEVFVKNTKMGQQLRYTILDKEGKEVASKTCDDTKTTLDIKDVTQEKLMSFATRFL